MTPDDFNELDRLLGKLRSELEHEFAIACSTHDSYSIAIFDGTTGNRKAHKVSGSIEETVKMLKETIVPFKD